MLENNMRIMRNEKSRVTHEMAQFTVRIQDNEDKIKKNRVLPYLVSNVVEVIEVEPEEGQDEATMNINNQVKGKCAIIKTTTRQVRIEIEWVLCPGFLRLRF